MKVRKLSARNLAYNCCRELTQGRNHTNVESMAEPSPLDQSSQDIRKLLQGRNVLIAWWGSWLHSLGPSRPGHPRSHTLVTQLSLDNHSGGRPSSETCFSGFRRRKLRATATILRFLWAGNG
uniref:Uncharacterized protein n=1 Tax=Lynx canadensis TaxID=61383 RepID=A0A667GY51_LYNCA